MRRFGCLLFVLLVGIIIYGVNVGWFTIHQDKINQDVGPEVQRLREKFAPAVQKAEQAFKDELNKPASGSQSDPNKR